MQKDRFWSRWGVGLLSVVAFVAVALIGTVFKEKPPSNSGEWAAWIQSLGAIVALAVSIGVGWFSAAAARGQQRAEWHRRRLEAAEGSLDRLLVIQALMESAYKGLDESVNESIPVQPWVLTTLDQCIQLIMSEVRHGSSSGSADDWADVLKRAIALAHTAHSWAAKDAGRGGSRYEMLKQELLAKLKEMADAHQECVTQRSSELGSA